METFAEPREFVENTRFPEERRAALATLELNAVDEPIADIVAGFAELPYSFTMQCCYGHFICDPAQNPYDLAPMPPGYGGRVRYRIAYIAFCLENSERGRGLRESLARLTRIDPGYVQFGSPDWFWRQWDNSYALQVEPAAHRFRDEAVLEAAEALHTQNVRDIFFRELRAVQVAEFAEYRGG